MSDGETIRMTVFCSLEATPGCRWTPLLGVAAPMDR
jgi:hypothetical protein